MRAKNTPSEVRSILLPPPAPPTLCSTTAEPHTDGGAQGARGCPPNRVCASPTTPEQPPAPGGAAPPHLRPFSAKSGHRRVIFLKISAPRSHFCELPTAPPTSKFCIEILYDAGNHSRSRTESVVTCHSVLKFPKWGCTRENYATVPPSGGDQHVGCSSAVRPALRGHGRSTVGARPAGDSTGFWRGARCEVRGWRHTRLEAQVEAGGGGSPSMHLTANCWRSRRVQPR